jgi:RNA recognition motif-containing protein
MRIFTGNISSEVTEEDLRKAFEPFGTIESLTLMKDRATNTPKGFAFIEMPAKAEADAAIAGLHGKELKGKNLVVNEARPKGGR